MAQDVASLGLSVDSGPVEKGSRALEKLSGSARRAEGAAKRLSGATGAAESALEGEASAADRAANSLQRHSRAARSANDNVRRLGGGFSGLAAQVQDIGVTASMGMSPLLIALQQGTQIAGQMEMAVKGGTSALGVLGAAVRSILSPLTLFSIGLTAVAAAALQMVNWGRAASGVLNTLANILPRVANEAAIAGTALAVAFSPAILRSVITLTAAIGTGLVGAIRAVGAAVLANPLTAFVLAIGAAVSAVYVFRDEVKNALGVDVIGIVKDVANTIIGSLVGAYNAVTATWSGIPAALGDLAYQGAQYVIDAFTNMARESIAIINGMIASINGALKDSGVALPFLPAPVQAVPRTVIDNPYAGSAGGVGANITGAFQSAMGTDYIGQIGTAIGNAATYGADKLRELASAASSAGETAAKAGSKGKSGIDKIAESAERAKQSLGQGLGGILQGLLNKTISWKDAMIKAVQSVLKYLDQMNVAQGGKGLFGGGIFGGLIKGFLGFANGGAFNRGRVLPFAFGGVVDGATSFAMSGGNTGVMGEAGPEGILPLRRGSDGRLGVSAANSNQKPSITIVNQIDATGADPAAVARLNAKLDEVNKSIPDQVVSVMGQNQTRGTY